MIFCKLFYILILHMFVFLFYFPVFNPHPEYMHISRFFFSGLQFTLIYSLSSVPSLTFSLSLFLNLSKKTSLLFHLMFLFLFNYALVFFLSLYYSLIHVPYLTCFFYIHLLYTCFSHFNSCSSLFFPNIYLSNLHFFLSFYQCFLIFFSSIFLQYSYFHISITHLVSFSFSFNLLPFLLHESFFSVLSFSLSTIM